MVNLGTKIGKLQLKNPVMAASGTFGPEYGELIDVNKLGAYIAKTITLNARIGNPPPRVCDTPSGMLNSIGLENGGLDDFIKNKLPPLKRLKIPLIASIAGDDAGEFKELTRGLSKSGKIEALEINLSCPNVKHGKRDFLIAQDEEATYETIEAVRRSTTLTIIAKLSPNVTDIKKVARAAERAGADALSLINTLVGMAIDIDTKRPVLGNITGGLSGPAIKPIALRMVREAYKSTRIPIVGIGGVMDYKDAVEFILCGASAIQVGTANFINPAASIEIIDGIKDYMAKNNIREIKKLTGALKT
ncbi:MAG: dihydroorotate dehydrogenase [Candidatus Omnitrophica bacterium]|nr:dihydroorotate dehydrogenase [Candidatus Omnitrophota bacterium]